MAISRAFGLAAAVLLLAAVATAAPTAEVAEKATIEAAKAKDHKSEVKCIAKQEVPLFAPGSGALYCPQGENNSTGCQLMSNGVDNVLRHAGSNLQQKVKFDCYKHIMSLDLKLKLAQFLGDKSAAVLLVSVNGQVVGRTAITGTFTEEKGERGTLWFGGQLLDMIPGQGPEKDEYVVKIELLNDLPKDSGAIIALVDPGSVAHTA